MTDLDGNDPIAFGTVDMAAYESAVSDCGDGTCGTGETICICPADCSNTSENCTDGLDNDCDGATDCADSDCAGTTAIIDESASAAAEVRWDDQGITPQDILSVTDDRWPYGRAVREHELSYCYAPTFVNQTRVKAQDALECLYELHGKLPASKTRSMVAPWILNVYDAWGFGWRGSSDEEDRLALPSPQILKALVLEQDRTRFNMVVLYALPCPTELCDEWIDFLDWLGGGDTRLFARTSRFGGDLAKALAKAFTQHPKRFGLLRLLACCASAGGTIVLHLVAGGPVRWTGRQLGRLAGRCVLHHTRIRTPRAATAEPHHQLVRGAQGQGADGA